MSLANPPIDPTLDPVTGLPTDASYFSQYQIPLASQPINLNELDAQGKQSIWLYPDHLPPVVARLQARDLTNEGNAQDLSTDGKRNLNVNIAKSSIPSAGGLTIGAWATWADTWHSRTAPALSYSIPVVLTPGDFTHIIGLRASVAIDETQAQAALPLYLRFGFELHQLLPGAFSWELFGNLLVNNAYGSAGVIAWHQSWIPPAPISLADNNGLSGFSIGFVADGNISPVVSASVDVALLH